MRRPGGREPLGPAAIGALALAFSGLIASVWLAWAPCEVGACGDSQRAEAFVDESSAEHSPATSWEQAKTEDEVQAPPERKPGDTDDASALVVARLESTTQAASSPLNEDIADETQTEVVGPAPATQNTEPASEPATGGAAVQNVDVAGDLPPVEENDKVAPLEPAEPELAAAPTAEPAQTQLAAATPAQTAAPASPPSVAESAAEPPSTEPAPQPSVAEPAPQAKTAAAEKERAEKQRAKDAEATKEAARKSAAAAAAAEEAARKSELALAEARKRMEQSVLAAAGKPADAPKADAAVAAAGKDLSGTWELRNAIDTTTYRPYLGLRLSYRIRIEQHGNKIVATGEKLSENGRVLPQAERTPIFLEGNIEGQTVKLTFSERYQGGTTGGTINWQLAPSGQMSGRFASNAAKSSGISSARRVSPR